MVGAAFKRAMRLQPRHTDLTACNEKQVDGIVETLPGAAVAWPWLVTKNRLLVTQASSFTPGRSAIVDKALQFPLHQAEILHD